MWLVLALGAGLLTGWIDNPAAAVQGPVLVLMVADFALTLPGRAPVHTRGRVRLLRERLSRLESALDPARFQRTHRSAIVRLDLIRGLNSDSPYSCSATLATGARVPVSRERLEELERRLARRVWCRGAAQIVECGVRRSLHSLIPLSCALLRRPVPSAAEREAVIERPVEERENPLARLASPRVRIPYFPPSHAPVSFH
jgi:hypothetical protein